MSRVTLTPDLPPQTAAFKRYEAANIELNRFYWVFRVSLEYMTPQVSTVANVPALFQSPNAAKNLNISSRQFLAESPETERVARHSMLTLAITSFEEYLKDVLTTFLITNWKPDKTYKIAFRPEELPAQNEVVDWLKNRSVKAIADEHIGKNYSVRFTAIAKLITSFGAGTPNLSQYADLLGTAACEARNCIVHASGIVDERTKNSLIAYLPSLSVGDKLDIDEDLLWKFLGALRDSARAIDVEIRKLV